MSDEIIISDASPLIVLVDIGELDLLQKLYRQVLITDVVKNEIHADLPNWINVTSEYDKKQFQILKLELDSGEASAIALAMETPERTIIIDESKGRSVAKRLGLRVTGTIGILIKAKDNGLIESGHKILAKLEDHGFCYLKNLENI